VAPAYIEYFKIKKAVTGIVQSGAGRGTVGDVRGAFERRRDIDDFEAVTGRDLEITKDPSGEVVISFSYPKQVPLFGNISLLINFSGSSSQ
jgi:hypothetical protein